MPTENRITEQPDEVKRYRFKGAAGEYVYAGDFDNATRLFSDATERCLAAERREQALQLRLNAADQRIGELERALREVVHNYNHGHLQHTHKAIVAAEELIEPAEAERDQGIPGTSFQRLNMLANQGE